MTDINIENPQDLNRGNSGSLPSMAPLAVPYVPFQDEDPPIYDNSNEALARGTVFPGLDMPWMNSGNSSNPCEGTLAGDLYALEFAADDLQLYLDTHESDQKVFGLFQYFQTEAAACQKEYVEKYGPLSTRDLLCSSEYDWLRGPWPWDYIERTE